AEDHAAPGAASLPAAAGAAAASADPLERSSLLMSLGNHAEARALLESALAAAPDNTALRMRLLEVLHTLRDAAAFRREVGPLRQLVYGDTDPMWLRVARMGRELCPDDPMFIGTVAATPPGMPATSPRMPVTPMPAPASAAAAAPARVDDEVWSDLDFKPMDMPEAAPAATMAPKAPAVAPARLPPAAVVPPGPSLDFEPVEVRRPAEKPAPVPVPAPATTPEDLLADLGWSDADLGAPPAMPEKPVTATPAPRPAEVADLDFGDDLAAFLPPRQASTPAQAAAKPVAVDPATAELADDLGFSFQPVSAPAPAPLPVVPAPAAAPPVPASTADTRGEDEFVETKLDLALAYIDMDDPLGAKSLLEEVLQEGGSSQRSRAQALLERLAS
ncbi:MAG: tetratricopeptide repeat protein, partial [Lysobacterales bacterium]